MASNDAILGGLMSNTRISAALDIAKNIGGGAPAQGPTTSQPPEGETSAGLFKQSAALELLTAAPQSQQPSNAPASQSLLGLRAVLLAFSTDPNAEFVALAMEQGESGASSANASAPAATTNQLAAQLAAHGAEKAIDGDASISAAAATTLPTAPTAQQGGRAGTLGSTLNSGNSAGSADADAEASQAVGGSKQSPVSHLTVDTPVAAKADHDDASGDHGTDLGGAASTGERAAMTAAARRALSGGSAGADETPGANGRAGADRTDSAEGARFSAAAADRNPSASALDRANLQPADEGASLSVSHLGQAHLASDQADPVQNLLDLQIWTASGLDAGQTERAGVLASFILNAAMIPGWPAPRPFELQRALVPTGLQEGQTIDPAELFKYLANLGADPALVSRLRKILEKLEGHRLRLLLAFAVLLTGATQALKALQEELMALADELLELEESAGGGKRTLVG